MNPFGAHIRSLIMFLTKEELELKYSKAKNAFEKCINYEENEYLSDEIGFSVKDIIVKYDSVKIEYSYSSGICLTSIKVLLLSEKNERIGTFTLVEDDNEDIIDDILVFTSS
ncbi:hypothetical protein [Tenacibaculum jejuense]|uniref:Uncharacterized protein n=1 Tax=Tenacibaculum jejuense TaxID=584609 RepID=A0A238UCE8_9FLAO|nr:hypothetical protein [Tenacibaculum jejuense]SNR16238.1 Protein of unknown function [Tenacibaculum jejuense]